MKAVFEQEKEALLRFRKAVSHIVADTREQRKNLNARYAERILMAVCKQAKEISEDYEYLMVPKEDSFGKGVALYAGWEYSAYKKSGGKDSLKPDPLVDLRVRKTSRGIEVISLEYAKGIETKIQRLAKLTDRDGMTFDGLQLEGIFDYTFCALAADFLETRPELTQREIEFQKVLRQRFHAAAGLIEDNMMGKRQLVYVRYAARVVRAACTHVADVLCHQGSKIIHNENIEDRRTAAGGGTQICVVGTASQPVQTLIDMRSRTTLYGIDVFTVGSVCGDRREIYKIADIADDGAAIFTQKQYMDIFNTVFCAVSPSLCRLKGHPTQPSRGNGSFPVANEAGRGSTPASP